MTNCDEFQIALEMKRAKVLDEAESAALDAHLQSCVSCQQYASAMGRMEETMTAEVMALNLTDIRRRLTSTLAHDQMMLRRYVGVAVVVFGAVGYLLYLSDFDWGRAAYPLAMAAFCLVNVGYRVVKHLSVSKAARFEGSPVNAYRASLRAQLRVWDLSLLLIPLFGWQFLSSLRKLSFEEEPVVFSAVLVVAVIVVPVSILWQWRRRQQDLRRELQELS